MRVHPTRVLAVAGVVLAGGFLFVGPASAHVSANPSTAEQGGFTKISLRVPTESDTASTVKLTVSIPQDTPVPFVSAGQAGMEGRRRDDEARRSGHRGR